MDGKIRVKRGISISRMFANIPTRNYYSRCSSLNVSPEVFAFHLAETNIGEPLLEKKSLTGDDFTHRRMTFLNSLTFLEFIRCIIKKLWPWTTKMLP